MDSFSLLHELSSEDLLDRSNWQPSRLDLHVSRDTERSFLLAEHAPSDPERLETLSSSDLICFPDLYCKNERARRAIKSNAKMTPGDLLEPGLAGLLGKVFLGSEGFCSRGFSAGAPDFFGGVSLSLCGGLGSLFPEPLYSFQ